MALISKNSRFWVMASGLCVAAVVVMTASSCATRYNPLDEYREIQPSVVEAPSPSTDSALQYDPELAKQGKYLVELLGCASCHSDGALLGRPDPDKRLAGSSVGIAYSNPLVERNPGVVYPGNLTPDPDTGLGLWSDGAVVRVIRSGVDKYGRQQLPVMPWLTYSKISQEDAEAIVIYLRSLPPIRHQVPNNVPPGGKARPPYVHFGVYQKK